MGSDAVGKLDSRKRGLHYNTWIWNGCRAMLNTADSND